MYRAAIYLIILSALVGCESAPDLPTSEQGLFVQIEGAVEDIHTNVFGDYYSGELGDDRLGLAVASFQEAVAGTELQDDADKLAKKVTEVSTLASTRPPIAKLRQAVQELKDTVAEVKKEL